MKKMRYTLWLLGCLLIVAGCTSSAQLPAGEQTVQQMEHQVEAPWNSDYLLYLPEGYNEREQDWPLMVFLHGGGERGDSLDLVTVHGPPKLAAQGRDFPFILVAPQCPTDQRWTDGLDYLDALLDQVIDRYRVDEERIYLTGLSMGGFGTWAWSIAQPDRFAALAPVCGGGDPSQVCAIENIPTWVFHGAEDEVVPLERSEEMVEALEACGGTVKLTVYPDRGHDSWTPTYDNPELYEWFLEQQQ